MNRAARTRAGADQPDDEVIIARLLARRLWEALKARTGMEAEALFAPDVFTWLDPAYAAAERLWDRERIAVEPCRRILDAQGNDLFVAHFPGGETRNLSREQLLMMGGQL